MRKYFIVDGFQRKGPFTIEELISHKITQDTIIWTFELGNETPAGQVGDLIYLFSKREEEPEISEKEEITEEKIETSVSPDEIEKIKETYEQKKREEKKTEASKKSDLDKDKKLDKYKKKDKESNVFLSQVYDADDRMKKEEENRRLEQERQKKETEERRRLDQDRIAKEKQRQEQERLRKEQERRANEKQKSNVQNLTSIKQEQSFIKQPVPKPKNWILQAILVTLFCCMPLGIVAIIFASQVDQKYNQGDYLGATKASKNAKSFITFTGIAGILMWVIYFVAYMNS